MKRYALLTFVLFAFALQTCRSEPTKLDLNAQPNPQNQPTPAQGVAAPAPAEFQKTFVGAMDGKFSLRMTLERQGGRLTGSYFYDKPGAFNVAERTLRLEGRVDNQGNATLTETVQNFESGGEQKTGEFKGKLEAVSVNGDTALRFSGTWISAKDKKTLSFAVRELRYDLGGLKFDEKKQKSEDKRLRYEIETALPQLAGENAARAGKFNQAVNAFVVQRTGGFKKTVGEMARADAAAKPAGEPPPAQQSSLDVSYEITAANKDFISVLFYFSEYTGGAHPNTATSSLTYDLNRNTAVNLADLFTPGSNHLKVISDYAIRELKKVKTVDDPEAGAAAKPENFHSWNITPSGLKITFDRYQVSAYAAGDHEVVVPYSVLKPIIKPDGLLAQFVK